MPRLSNLQRETYARVRAAGFTCERAYKEAGYKGGKRQECRVAKGKGVAARIIELRGEPDLRITSILPPVIDKLMSLAELAGKMDSAAAMTAAKGLLLEATKLKIQLSTHGAEWSEGDDLQPDMSEEEWFRTYAPPK